MAHSFACGSDINSRGQEGTFSSEESLSKSFLKRTAITSLFPLNGVTQKKVAAGPQ